MRSEGTTVSLGDNPAARVNATQPRNARLGLARSGCVSLLMLLAGCNSPPDYPIHLSFPSRTDRLVLKLPEKNPANPGSPGKLESELAELDSLGGQTLLPSAVPAEHRSTLDRFLRDSFGTPAEPAIQRVGDDEITALIERLGLASQSLADAGKLFRKHCQSCHGLSGDGRGPAGLFISPYPRDFRRGSFKFVSTGEATKPRQADIVRTITEGLRGTAMPSFGLIPQQERELLARYVVYLAIRGQVEFQSLSEKTSESAIGEGSVSAGKGLKKLLQEWEKAGKAPPLPAVPDDGDKESEKYLAAVRRGFELFVAKTGTECLKCHGDFGRQPQLRYEIWGTIARPANFTESALKGGDRTEDLFARIRHGIAPVGMPAHPALTDRQVWDLVRFVRSAPYPRELPKDVRDVVYPVPKE